MNPFQIENITAVPVGVAEFDNASQAWYKIGDWHDTVQYPTNNTDPIIKMRYAADQFSGHMIFHCHLLNHEDRGMMAQYDLQGDEGTLWPGARTVDPTCVLPPMPPMPTNKPTNKPSKAAKTKAGKKL